MAAAIVGYDVLRRSEDLDRQAIVRPRSLGTTFSQLQCKYFGMDFKETFLAIRDLGFDVMRFCTYWNEIEPNHGEFDFSVIDWILENAHGTGWQIVVCVGMKTPRWPEFHFPQWVTDKYNTDRIDIPLDSLPGLAEDALAFTQTVVEHIQQGSKVTYWQVENEALNHAPVAGLRYLSNTFVQAEINLVKGLVNSNQKILFTFGVDSPFAIQDAGNMIQPMLPIVDAVGFNVYAKVPTGIGLVEYLEPAPPFWQNVKRWKDFVTSNQREAWIAESQAEPWESTPGKHVHIENRTYPSSNPELATKLASKLATLGFDPVLLWGCEHWYWHKKQGHTEWWDAMAAYLNLQRK